MKKLLLFLAGVFFFAASTHAQKIDASLGGSYFRFGGSGGFNSVGVSGSVAYLPNKWIGFTGDFGGYHGSPNGISLNTYTYLVGPRFYMRNPTHFTPFVQGLVGGSRFRVSGATSSSSYFSYSFGGGIDFPIVPRLSFRPQVDYIGIKTPVSHTDCTRFSGSFVFHF